MIIKLATKEASLIELILQLTSPSIRVPFLFISMYFQQKFVRSLWNKPLLWSMLEKQISTKSTKKVLPYISDKECLRA